MKNLRKLQLCLAGFLGAANAFLALLGSVYVIDYVSPNYPAFEGTLKFTASIAWVIAVFWPFFVWFWLLDPEQSENYQSQEPTKSA